MTSSWTVPEISSDDSIGCAVRIKPCLLRPENRTRDARAHFEQKMNGRLGDEALFVGKNLYGCIFRYL